MKSRRRIAFPQGLRSAPTITYEGAITAGIYDRRNGVRLSFCVATKLRIECPLWVKSRHRGTSNQCPLYPRKQTLLLSSGMFALLPISDIAPNRSSKQREATYWPFGIAVRLAQEQIYAYREYESVGAG